MSGPRGLDHPAETSYLERFQFLEAPFLQSPDRRFVYRSESHALAVEHVVEAITRGDRLIVVTGNEGSGKTTLCLELSQSFPARTAVSIVLDPRISAGDLLHQLFADFDLGPPVSVEPVGESPEWRDGRPELHTLLQMLAEEQRQGVVVIDDAQNVDLDIWGELFVTWNADENQARLQVVFVGQTRIDKWMQEVDALGRGAIHREALSPLSRHEVKEYVERRMWVAQGGVAALSELTSDSFPADLSRRTVRRPHFSGIAINMIANASQGNPRLVNAICDQALTRASERSSDYISGRLVNRAAVDLGLPGTAATWRVWPSRWTVAGALGLGLAVGLFAAASVKQKAQTPAATEQVPPPAILSPTYDQKFDAFRKLTLQRATTFSSVPDVRGLLHLREDVLLWQRQTSDGNHQAIKDLLNELERLTNEARARRLALDRQQFLEDAKRQR